MNPAMASELRSVAAAEPGWSDKLIGAAQPQQFLLSGDARTAWEDRLCEARWLHLKFESERPAKIVPRGVV
jgi:hypothetical protein